MELLKYKHHISLELIPYQNWDSLVNLLAKSLAEIIDARTVNLSTPDPISQTYECITEWTTGDAPIHLVSSGYCQACLEKNSVRGTDPHYCDAPTDLLPSKDGRVNCFPIFYKDTLYALARFVLKPGCIVTEAQRQILLSVSDEVIAALMAGQDRKRLSELELAKAALAERQAMSHYLHDNLGQNLGYLRMKLEQYINHSVNVSGRDEYRNDLVRMRDVAEQSYQIVRNKLEVSIPDSTPLLTNYLHEHARKVSERSKIEIQFISQGSAKPVSVDLQRALFYVFQEALSNVEKHAQASKVDVLLSWEDDNFSIVITDNGKGFKLGGISREKHFGLEIMRERMMAVGGHVEVCPTIGSGTSVRINAPIHFNKKSMVAAHG